MLPLRTNDCKTTANPLPSPRSGCRLASDAQRPAGCDFGRLPRGDNTRGRAAVAQLFDAQATVATMRTTAAVTAIATACAFLAVSAATGAEGAPAKGPLRVHPNNPRYFTDETGKAIYLTGIQYEDALREDAAAVPTAVEYRTFLNTVAEYNLNFVRLWRWSELFRYRYEEGEPFATSFMPW